MTLVVLIILAVIWAAVLVPPYLQSRSENRPADSITAFRNQLSVLERRSGYGPSDDVARYRSAAMAPMQARRPARPLVPAEVRKRRRDILGTLLAAAGLTLVLGFVIPAAFMLHLVVDVVLAAYVVLLLRVKRAAEERAAKVRYLPRTQAPAYRSAQPQLALRRSAAH